MQDFRNLMVWKKAHQLTLDIYNVTTKFPKEELYGLTSQLRRSSSSIAMNISERCGRSGDPEFARYIAIAIGSTSETEYSILLARDLELINSELFERLNEEVNDVKRMLISLHKRLKKLPM